MTSVEETLSSPAAHPWRRFIVTSLIMVVVALTGWAIFVQRPVYHAKTGFVRLICPGTADVEVPHRPGLRLNEALKAVPAFAQFGIDEGVSAIWSFSQPTHSAWSDLTEALRPYWPRQIDSWLGIAPFPSPPATKLNDELHSGEAVHMQSRW
jgi:hypothetical protein